MTVFRITPIDSTHSIPDISHVFEGELENILLKLKIRNAEFDLVMDSAHALVYYAIRLCITYQQEGNGGVPLNIVEEIWRQVLNAGKSVYQACGSDEFNQEVSNIFRNKLKEPNILDETLHYWEHYRL